MPRKPKEAPIKYCERCGKQLYRKRYGKNLEDMTVFMKRKYCSLRCANSRGVQSMSSTSQHRISQQYVKEHCERCGAEKNLHVHHKNGDWTDHRRENLETLCIRCHLGVEHRKPAKTCKFCQSTARRNGMCQKHFQRFKKYGDPFLTKIRLPGYPNSYTLTKTPS